MHDTLNPQYPPDQAHGLRSLFAHSRVRLVPVVANSHMTFGGVVLERLCSALSEQGAHVLVIDASDRAPTPAEIAVMDLGECIEFLSPQVSYLAARGLPLRYVDAKGSTAGFLEAVIDAAPQVDVALMYAGESDICRLFMHSQVRPLLLAEDHPASVTQAYAAMKLLTQRAGLVVYDMLLCAPSSSPRIERIAMQLATCADDFLGAVLRDWIHLDPSADARQSASPALQRWANEILYPAGERAGVGRPPRDRSQQALN